MCILPNFEASNLEQFAQKRKKGNRKAKKAATEIMEIIVPEQPQLENPI